jgi:hypothetical protein
MTPSAAIPIVIDRVFGPAASWADATHTRPLHRRMTSARLREVLALLHWSQRGLADVIDRQERQVRRWAAGEYSVPADIAAWLERLVAFHKANPPPQRAVAADEP